MKRRDIMLGILSLPVGLYCMAHDIRLPRRHVTIQGYKITAKGYKWQ